MKRLAWFRRSSQLAVIALFCALPWLNANGYGDIKGSLFAFEAFSLHFADPATAAQTMISSAAHGHWPLLALLLGASLALLIAFLLGRVFCGWLCPYGLFSELAAGLRRQGGINYRYAIAIKGGVVLAALALACLFAYPAISLLSFPGQLSLAPLLAWEEGAWMALIALLALPILALLAELATGKRLWCVYLCPQSLFLGAASSLLPKKAPGLRIAWDARKCTCKGASPCREACGLGLNPRRKGGPKRFHCQMCGDCVQACQKRGGAIGFAVFASNNLIAAKAHSSEE